MKKYLLHGSVGVMTVDQRTTVHDYEDVEVEYESKRPLNVNDDVDFAFAYTMVKNAYMQRLIDDGRASGLTSDVMIDVLSCGLTEWTDTIRLRVEDPNSALKMIRFQDAERRQCRLNETLQKGDGKGIALGIDKVEAKYYVPNLGWKIYRLPDHFVLDGVMQLTRPMVKELLPHLQRFAETGDL